MSSTVFRVCLQFSWGWGWGVGGGEGLLGHSFGIQYLSSALILGLAPKSFTGSHPSPFPSADPALRANTALCLEEGGTSFYIWFYSL